jgi:hypothetical protein
MTFDDFWETYMADKSILHYPTEALRIGWDAAVEACRGAVHVRLLERVAEADALIGLGFHRNGAEFQEAEKRVVELAEIDVDLVSLKTSTAEAAAVPASTIDDEHAPIL